MDHQLMIDTEVTILLFLFDCAGSLVERVTASDIDGQVIRFSIEPNHFDDASGFFTINPKTGEVRLSQPLKDAHKKNLYLYVVADDGDIPSKVQVWVSVLPSRRESNVNSIAPFDVKPELPVPAGIDNRPRVTSSSWSETNDFVSADGLFAQTSLNSSVPRPSAPSVQGSSAKQPENVTTEIPAAFTEQNLYIIVAVMVLATSALLISLVTTGIYCFRRRKKRRKRADDAGSDQDSTNLESILAEWEFPRYRLRILDILGEGFFGQVWKGEAINIKDKEGVTTVAIKMLKKNAGQREKKDLISELKVMTTLNPHPNVVSLLGCCAEKDPLFIILEYVALGKLQTFLRNSRNDHSYHNLYGGSCQLTSKDLTSFAYQVATGMEYLSSKGIIHRDLAARNILLDSDRTCKVADFGFARDVLSNFVYERKSEGQLPIRWMAPESLYDNIFTTRSDVWSFGILMWEIVTLGSTPYPGMGASEVVKSVRTGYRLEKPNHCKREIYNIMFYCWDDNPSERPSFSEVVKLLERLVMSETDYIELDRFPDHSYYNIIVDKSDEKV